MLKEKAVKANAIVAIKLTTGEEIICQMVEPQTIESMLMVSRPLTMVMVEGDKSSQQMKVVFTPWMIAAGKDHVGINRQHVLAMVPAKQDAAAQYEQAVSS
jgi:hypothetical protein